MHFNSNKMSQPLSLTITTTITTTTTTSSSTTHRSHLQFCQRCKEDESVFTKAFMHQQCLKCGYRPNVDCFHCKQNDCLSGDALRGRLHCLQCGWSEPDYNHIVMENEPVYEEDRDNGEPIAMETTVDTRKQSRKNKRDAALADHAMKSTEEQRKANQEKTFCNHIKSFMHRVRNNNKELDVTDQCLAYLTAYQNVLKRKAEQGKPQLNPVQQSLAKRKREIMDKYAESGYKKEQFDQDSKRFDTDAYKFTQQIEKHIEAKKEFDQLWDDYKGAFDTELDLSRDHNAPIQDPGPLSEELHQFLYWKTYRDELESIDRELKRKRSQIGRVSDNLNKIEEIAVACLFLHNEQTSCFGPQTLEQFYRKCTGILHDPMPQSVISCYTAVKEELKLSVPDFKHRLQTELDWCKKTITSKTGLRWKDGDEKRIQLQVSTLDEQQQSDEQEESQLKLLAAAVLLNALKVCKIPLEEGKRNWSIKFIADNLGLHASKISEIAKGMKFKIDLLCHPVLNSSSS
jgi:hypothetical protein